MSTLNEFFAGITTKLSGLRPPPSPCNELDLQVTSASVLTGDPSLTPGSFCMPVERLEPLLRDAALEVVSSERCATGLQGAQIVYLRFAAEKLLLKAKWKEASHGGTGFNNEPRKELAAYMMQRWFLAPGEYVVPPTVLRAIPHRHYVESVHETKPNFDGTDCVVGVLAAWIEHTEDMPPFDAMRFSLQPAYRDTMANLNLLTYLIDHRDPRPANFLFSLDPERPRALSIDHGLAFSGLMNPRILFKHEWRELIVPQLPLEKLDRLRGLCREDLDRLRTVAQMELRDGVFHSVEPEEELIAGDGPVRRDGDILQLGLEAKEIDDVEQRIYKLLRDADEGNVQLY